MNVAARVCRSPDSWAWTSQISLPHSPTPPKCTTRAILALINNLGIVYHQFCSSSLLGIKFVVNVVVFYALLHCRRAHIVEYLFFDAQSCCSHSVYQLLVCSHHFSLCPVLHRLGEDVGRVKVDGHHDVSVAALGHVGECSCLVGVDLFGEVFHPDKDIAQFLPQQWTIG